MILAVQLATHPPCFPRASRACLLAFIGGINDSITMRGIRDGWHEDQNERHCCLVQ